MPVAGENEIPFFTGNRKLTIGNYAAMPTVSKDVRVVNTRGFHARPAMQFADLANQFGSRVTVFKGGDEPYEADGKSVMQLIILAAVEGTPMRIEAEGEDAQVAVDQLAELFATGFGEED